MTRAPFPDPDKTFHLVGDVQGIPYLGSKTARADAVLDDMATARIPDVSHRIQVGDFISSHTDDAFPPTIEFMNKLGTGAWHATVGNHDHDRIGDPTRRTQAQAAALMGMPAPNFVVDMGYAVAIYLFVRAWGGASLTDDPPVNVTWLAAQLDAHAGRTCMIVSHPSIRGTMPVGGAAEIIYEDHMAIVNTLATRPQAKVWLCGHTHSPLIHPVARTVSVGSRTIAQVNASALLNTAPGDANDHRDPIRSLYVTVNPTNLAVRFRDHGAHQWVGGSPTSQRVVTLPL